MHRGQEVHTTGAISDSDLVRQHASDEYLTPAHRRGGKRFSINVGVVHRALGLSNRVPLVCAALASKKFLKENHLRLVSRTGPPSGQSTTVTYTYEFLKQQGSAPDRDKAWRQMRGLLKDVYAELGGGEAYLRAEREAFRGLEENEEND
jgi:hypothetical protein